MTNETTSELTEILIHLRAVAAVYRPGPDGDLGRCHGPVCAKLGRRPSDEDWQAACETYLDETAG